MEIGIGGLPAAVGRCNSGTLWGRALTLWTRSLIPILGLTLLVSAPTSFAQPRTISGQSRTADGRAVMSMRGLAALQMMRGDVKQPKKTFPYAMPRGNPYATEPEWMPEIPGDGLVSGEPSAELTFSPASAPIGPSPAVATSFQALEDIDVAAPPDVGGAVGLNHVMTVHNDRIRVQDRTGVALMTMTLNGFWIPVGNFAVFSPRVVYDPFNERWIFSAAANQQSDRSCILLAVSKTSDPTADWNYYRLDADPMDKAWASEPTLGFNKDWIVVTVTMNTLNPNEAQVRPYAGMYVHVFNKTNLYAAGQGLVTSFKDESLKSFAAAPAVTYDNNLSTMYLVQVDNLHNAFGSGITGTFGNVIPPFAVNRLEIATITGSVGAEILTLGAAFTPSVEPWFPSDLSHLNQFAFSFFFGNSGQQLGGFGLFDGIDLGDSRVQNVVFRNGSLWCTHSVFMPANPLIVDIFGFTQPIHSGVQWWQLTPSGGIEQLGRLEDTTGTNSYAYPSIAVGRCEDVLIGYSSFSPNQYASANYSFRFGTDPTNTLRADAVLKAGEGFYDRSGTNFLFNNTWGRYSSTVVDPINDLDMWTIQEYAELPAFGTNSFFGGRWGTWWGRIDVIGGNGNQVVFSASDYTVTEGTSGFATISVLNIGGAPGSVDYAATGPLPSTGTIASGTLTFASGQTSTNFTVPIQDDSELNPNRIIALTLTNLQGTAILGCANTADLTVIDDESLSQPNVAGEFLFSSYLNFGIPYIATENETLANPFCDGNSNDRRNIVQPDRSAPGVIVTVVRTNGHTGRVLVDYNTEPGGSAVPGFDYIPTSGTLVFDDYQMSASFLVPILSDNTGFFLFVDSTKWVRLVLSNPRPAPEEEDLESGGSPGYLKPRLASGSESGIIIRQINGGTLDDPNDPDSDIVEWWNIERQNYRVDEYGTNGNVRRLVIDVTLFPLGGPGSVTLVVSSLGGGQLYFPVLFPLINLEPDPRYKYTFNAGSERAEAFEGQNATPFLGNVVWANPVNEDLSSVTITNFSDYAPIQVAVAFPPGACRRAVEIIITNDTTVEFNEDLIVYLAGGGNIPFGPQPYTTVTILQDDAPAGALDREWNPDNASHTFPAFNQTPGANLSVSGLAVQSDGKTVLVGDFTRVNGEFRNHVARMNIDGSLDYSFEPGGGADGFVSALALYPQGSLNQGQALVVGGFRAYDSFNVYGIARLLANGSRDSTFNVGTGTFNQDSPRPNRVDPIRALAIQADGRIVVGGDFTLFNGISRAGLARLNSNGSVDDSFNPGAGLGAADSVWALAMQPDGAGGQKAIVGGDFNSIGGQPYSNIARLNADGSVDTTFASGSGANGSVYAVAVQPNGRILVAGDFSTFNERPFNRVVRLNLDGSVDDTFNPGSGPDGPVMALALQTDGKPMIGGWFTRYDGTRRVGLARLYVNGTLDTSFLDTAYNQFAGLINDFSFQAPNYVSSVALQPDGNVMIGGSFTQVGGNASTNAPLRNSWTVFTRADKRARYNIARLIGGGTPGPGNASFDSQTYLVDEGGKTASLKVKRTDGRLGTLTAASITTDRLGTGGVDYVSNRVTTVWPEAFYMTNFLSVDPFNWTPVSVGLVDPLFVRVPIIDDSLQEGDELVDVKFVQPGGSVTLGGEYIPLGGALGRSTATLTIADNDVDHGVFGFGISNFTVGEDSGIATVTVIRTNGSVGQVSVYASTIAALAPPRATAGSPQIADYRALVNHPVIFQSGQTVQTFEIEIHPDNLVEFDENIGLVLNTPTGGAKLPAGQSNVIATLTIVDADFLAGRINFKDVTFTTNEGAGSAVITVTRTGGSQGRVAVDYTTVNGTATAPADYTTSGGTLVWNDGDSAAKTFVVPLIADGIVDNATNRFETIGLRLFNPIIGVAANTTLLGSRTNATLSVEDGDAYGSLVFSQPVYQADEIAGSVTVTVIRQNGTAGTVSANYSVTSVDSPVPGEDYIPTNGLLTFLPGEIAKTFVVALVDDAGTDGDKNLILTLSNPTNASLGLINTALLTIVDNESFNIPAGDLDDSFSTNLMINGSVLALGLQPDGRILIGGNFGEVNRVPRFGLARLTAGAVLDASLNPGAGPNGEVRSIALQGDGKILLGGAFDQFNGTNRSGLARLNTDGTIDTAFNLGASFADNDVNVVLLQPDGRILVGGSFSTFNGEPRPGFVRLQTNGILDSAFAPGAAASSGANGPVYALALQPDGKILIGGDFDTVQGFTRTGIARMHPNGLLDLTFDATAALNGAVRSLLVRADGRIVAGGSFTTANGVARSRLAQFNADGTLDTTFLSAPLSGADNVVLTLAEQVDGKLVVGGDFRRFNDVTRARLTRLLADGSNDPTINFGEGADSFVAALLVQPDRKILFGGGFSTFDEKPRQRLARIHGGSIAGSGTLEFTRGQYVVSEQGTNVVVAVRRRGGTAGPVGVNFTTANGTALAGTDYQTTAGIVSFPEAETRTTISVPIIDNTVNSGDRTFTIELVQGSFTGGAASGLQPVASIVIVDDEGLITFSTAAYAVNENSINGGASITVMRNGGSNTTATVFFSTADGSARTPADYLSTNGVIAFQPGEVSKIFRIPIINDSVIEPRETVLLTLSTPSGSNLLGIASATLTITDDETALGQLLLSSLTYQVNETTTNAVVTVLRTNGYSGIVTVNYNTADGTAKAGQDYLATNGVLTFPDGESYRTIEIPILDDLLVEPIESFTIALSNSLGGAPIGIPGSATVTIVDTDTSLIEPVTSRLTAESVLTNGIIDPGERVTIQLGLRNNGSGDTPSLDATLQPGNGVVLSDGPQVRTYGVLPANSTPVEQPFTFTASGSTGDRLEAVLVLTDGPFTNAIVSFVFTIGGQATRSFTNSTAITINSNGISSPYPSAINVVGMGGTVTKVTVALSRLTHQFPADVDILLVDPTGERVMLMSDAGGSGSSFNPLNNVNLTFDANATSSLTATGQITSGTYRPVNFAGPGQNTSDTFPPPAPQPTTNGYPFTMFPYTNINLAVFNGANPNGLWSLFIYDDGAPYTGSLGGWGLTLQTSDPVSASPSAVQADLTVAATGTPNAPIGALIQWSFAVTNRGPATADSVALRETLPAGFSFAGANATKGNWTKVQNTLTWTVGDLPSGAGAIITVTGRPQVTGMLSSAALVSANQLDPNLANNSAAAFTSVAGLPNVSISRQAQSVRISWSASAGAGFKLQAANALNPADWQDVEVAPGVEGSQSVVYLGVGSTAKFYRLRSP